VGGGSAKLWRGKVGLPVNTQLQGFFHAIFTRCSETFCDGTVCAPDDKLAGGSGCALSPTEA